jgi:hypothetical protein
MIGIMLVIPLNQTPPTPHFDASTKPWYCGQCSTSSLTWVGSHPTNRNRADQSRKMLRNLSVMVMYQWCVLPAVARYLSSCPMICFPHGKEIDANCSLPCNFWKCRSSNSLMRRTSLNSASISLHFFWDNSIVLANPSNSKHSTSFRKAHVPSSINFFSDTGGPGETRC